MTDKAPMTLQEKKAARIKTITIVVLAVAVIAGLLITGVIQKAFSALFPVTAPDPRVQVVEAGVAASIGYEYNGDYDAWLANICSISDDFTCAYYTKEQGPLMQQESNKAQQSSIVTNVHAIKMVDETQEGSETHQEIWAVSYSYDNWIGKKDTYDYFMIIEETEGVWKFEGPVLVPQQMLEEAYGLMLTPQATVQP